MPCRTPEQISVEFDSLQQELESEITEARALAQEQLLNNFDQEVIEKVRIEAGNSRNRSEDLLWKITRYYLQPYARFDGAGLSFVLERNPFLGEKIHAGPYRMGRNVEDANTYRIGHPLAQRVLQSCTALDTPPAELTFDLTQSGKNISVLGPHVGHSGWLLCSILTVQALEAEDHILLAAVRDDGIALDPATCKRLFDLPAEPGQPILPVSIPALDAQLVVLQSNVLDGVGKRNNRWLDQEISKLDRWAEDLKLGLEHEIKDLDQQIRDEKRASTAAATLEDKVVHQRALKFLQTTRHQKRKDLFLAQDEVESRRDALIAAIEARMNKSQKLEPLFCIRWSLT